MKDGEIERSMTVQYLCGNELGIKRINENNTCHYVLAVTVPHLCVRINALKFLE